MLTVVAHIWYQNPKKWNRVLDRTSEYTKDFCVGLKGTMIGKYTLEQGRDRVRQHLNAAEPAIFPYGKVLTNITNVTQAIFHTPEMIAQAMFSCSGCNYHNSITGISTCIELPSGHKNTNEAVNKLLFNRSISCNHCQRKQSISFDFALCPSFLALFVHDKTISISKKLSIMQRSGKYAHFTLRGAIYGDGNHFTCRLFGLDQTVWFHDGITTGHHAKQDGHLSDFKGSTLHNCRGKELVLLIYAH